MNYYNDLSNKQAAISTFGPSDVVQAVVGFISSDPKRRMTSVLDPVAISGNQEVFLVWLSLEDSETKVPMPSVGDDMRIFRIPVPVDESLAGRTLMHGSMVRQTAKAAAEAAYQKRSHNYPIVYAFKDGYIVCFTPGGFPGLDVIFSDADQLPQEEVFQLWVDAPVLQFSGNSEA